VGVLVKEPSQERGLAGPQVPRQHGHRNRCTTTSPKDRKHPSVAFIFLSLMGYLWGPQLLVVLLVVVTS
jgi:hypothetical protein